MLGKLMKYELKATGRIMLPLYGSMIIMAFLCHFSVNYLSRQPFRFSGLINVLLISVFTLLTIAVGFMTVFLMAQRFYGNLLGDEGYLMFTLPVTVPGNIFSKLLVSIIWFFASVLSGFLSFFIVSFRVEYIIQFFRSLKSFFESLTPYYGLHGFLALLEMFVFLVVCMAAAVLVVYASIAIGHRFSSHRVLFSFVFFIGIMIASQIAAFIGIVILRSVDLQSIIMHLNEISGFHLVMLALIAAFTIYGAIFYFVTSKILNNHLNLD